MPDIKSFYICLSMILAGSGCIFNSGPRNIPVAKMGDEILYLSDLESIIPRELTGEDSILLAEDYVNKWIRTELMIKKANENLTLNQKDVSRELEEYRKSLIIYRYQKEVMLEKMDTIVKESELNDFYHRNRENFILSENIVKAFFIKIPLQVSNPEQAKAFCERTSAGKIKELQDFCIRNAVDYDLPLETWVNSSTLLGKFPGVPDDDTALLTRNSPLEARDDSFYYFICILGYHLKGSVAPLDYISETVRNLILNNRKTEFLKKIEEEIYLEGVRNNKFRIYDVINNQ